MAKRVLDVVLALIGLVVSAPVLLPVAALVWSQDFHSPFYIAPRTGRGGRVFRMVKLRSMEPGSDRSGVDSTAANDARITRVGQFVRAYKLDEIPQLWNVLWGDMSLVGPRPNVGRETDLYTEAERRLLDVRPGITDFASIVFADDGEILRDADNPDIAYNQLVRPWKSRLGLFYIEHRSLALDLRLIWLTALAVLVRPAALSGVVRTLERLGAPDDMRRVAWRNRPLAPTPPPGMKEIVTARTAD